MKVNLANETQEPKKVTVRIIENYQNLIIQLQSNILLILNPGYPDSDSKYDNIY